MDTNRLEAFSDGVLAVAITILALDLAVNGHGHLAHQFYADWPRFAAYIVSFFTIGVIWVNHHNLFKNVAIVDRTLLFANLVLLFFVVLIPFATSTMAEYLTVGGSNARTAALFYLIIMEGMGFSFGYISRWTMNHNLLKVPIPPEQSRAALIRFGVGSVGYLVAMFVALFSAPLALLMSGLIVCYYIAEQTPGATTSRRVPSGDDS